MTIFHRLAATASTHASIPSDQDQPAPRQPHARVRAPQPLWQLTRRLPRGPLAMPALLLSAALAGAVLAGCATTSAPRSGAAVAPYRDSIDLAGGIAINYTRDGKQEPLIGSFTWRQTRSSTDVSLTSPTGQIVAVINVTPGSATLKQSGKEPRTAPDLDGLTTQTLGWTLPVSGLRDWLQGYATDASGKRFVASPANNTVVTRDGWKVEYMTWQDDAAPVPQPKRIELTRLGAGQVDDLTIRIAIRPTAE